MRGFYVFYFPMRPLYLTLKKVDRNLSAGRQGECPYSLNTNFRSFAKNSDFLISEIFRILRSLRSISDFAN
jgi:hypothetical protein